MTDDLKSPGYFALEWLATGVIVIGGGGDGNGMGKMTMEVTELQLMYPPSEPPCQLPHWVHSLRAHAAPSFPSVAQ
jgi:hypothetical protein